MNKEEFFNLLTLISAFKDVVIGEETLIFDEELNLIENEQQEIQEEVPNVNDNLFQIHTDSTKKSFDNNDKEELNPEEWDPW
ncbi:MAG: hypothetical protein ACFE88_11275 [Candidatus Hermodarchaeota archaeon]